MMNIKKILCFLLAMILVLSLSVTAFAENEAETFTITINNSATGHTYEAYQIFTGKPHIVTDKDNNVTAKTLLEVTWGANAEKSGLVSEDDLKDITTEKAISYVNFDSNPFASTNTQSDGIYVISGLLPGYYLVRDKKDTLDGVHDAYTAFILEVVESSTVTPKSAKPTVDKQVLDEVADAEAGNTNGWGETADHAINESFQFKLIATLPADENFGYYETYKVIFRDNMSAGITFESIASVTVGNTTLTAEQYTCTATANQAGGSWSLTIADLTRVNGVTLENGTIVEVIYNAHLNENATINNDKENRNTVYLEYSNNPTVGGEGDTEDEDLGKTTEDHVWVFTYRVDNTKTDENANPLAGARFKLYKDEACTEEFALIYDNALTAYRPVKEYETGAEMVSATETGEFNVVGLDAGTYYLKETNPPEGYNPCDNIKIVISATHKEDSAESASTTIDTEKSQNISNTIINKYGVTLPETGGTGTTMIYTVGGILVLAAIVLLVTKKRMSAE